MISQMKNEALEDGTRQTCLEVLVTLCENAPGLMRKYPQFAPAIIPVVLDWMSELEDDQDWYAGETVRLLRWQTFFLTVHSTNALD